jgi:hypothetical protein
MYMPKPTRYDRRQNSAFQNICSVLLGLIATVALLSLVWCGYISYRQYVLDGDIDSNTKKLDFIIDQLDKFQLLVEKSQPNGYAPLDGDAIVPEIHLPPDLLEAAVYRGCWNAATNFPVITSSTGLDGEFFIVCTPGSTNINGNSEWNLYDIIIFDVGLVSWIRIDGGQNIITDTSAVGPNEVSIISDGLGPFFSLYKIAAGSDINITENGGALTITSTAAMINVTLQDSGPGSSLIINGIGPNLDIKTLVEGPGVTFIDDGVSLTINANSSAAELQNVNGNSGVLVSNDGLVVENPGTVSPFRLRALQANRGVVVTTFEDRIRLGMNLQYVRETIETTFVLGIDPVTGSNWVPSRTVPVSDIATCPSNQVALDCSCSCGGNSDFTTCAIRAQRKSFFNNRECFCIFEVIAIIPPPQTIIFYTEAICTA